MKIQYWSVLMFLFMGACATTTAPTVSVSNGMSKSQVFDAAGNPSKTILNSDSEVWVYKNNGYFCSVTFKNDKVDSKSPCKENNSGTILDDIGNGLHGTFVDTGIVKCSGEKPVLKDHCELRCVKDKWEQVCP